MIGNDSVSSSMAKVPAHVIKAVFRRIRRRAIRLG